EAFAELKRGNTDKEFLKMYRIALSKILDLPLTASVDYFRDVILDDIMTEDTAIDIRKITKRVLEAH
ncbi:MAG: hydrolase, partial [Planococcus sp. (in: firmicutes)]|nr:hydrolase [Planococcus sp. (in: firmicutes)]